jgi:hypothetical protein
LQSVLFFYGQGTDKKVFENPCKYLLHSSNNNFIRTQMPKISDISINDRFIKALEVPQNAPHKIYWDGKTTGFGVRITKSGAVSFVLCSFHQDP